MMVFINITETIGQIIISGTQSTTGDIFLTLLFIVMFLMVMAILFGIPLEFTAIFIMPLMFGLMTYSANFIAIGSVILIYLSIILTKNFIFK